MLAYYTTLLLFNAEERNRTSAALLPAVLQTAAFPFGHLSKREVSIFSFQTTKERRPKPNLTTASEAATLLNSLLGFFLRFGSGRAAPAGSLHVTAAIGEP